MKKFINVSMLTLIMMVIASASVSALDSTNFGVSETPPTQISNDEEITPFGLGKPKSTIDL